jgi:hypothetical protein
MQYLTSEIISVSFEALSHSDGEQFYFMKLRFLRCWRLFLVIVWNLFLIIFINRLVFPCWHVSCCPTYIFHNQHLSFAIMTPWGLLNHYHPRVDPLVSHMCRQILTVRSHFNESSVHISVFPKLHLVISCNILPSFCITCFLACCSFLWIFLLVSWIIFSSFLETCPYHLFLFVFVQ